MRVGVLTPSVAGSQGRGKGEGLLELKLEKVEQPQNHQRPTGLVGLTQIAVIGVL